MRAGASAVVAARRGGGTVLRDVRSDPPLSIRRAGGRVLVVGSAAGPVGGDELRLDVAVEAGCRASLGTAAATVVWPGPPGTRSATATAVHVGEGGHLTWRPEPLVSVAGSDHRLSTLVELADGATCVIVEEVALGRRGEASGRLDLDLRVTRASRPVVHHAEQLGPGRPGAHVAVGRARHLVAIVVVGPPAGDPATIVDGDEAAAWLPVAADAAMLLAVGPDRPATLGLVARLGVAAPAAACAYEATTG